MDTEGHEYEILRGMKNTLKSKKPLKLFIEFHSLFLSEKKINEILDFLKKQNFQIKKIFLEIPPHNYKDNKKFNYLLNKANLFQFGEVKKNDYNSLKHILTKKNDISNFFRNEFFLERV